MSSRECCDIHRAAAARALAFVLMLWLAISAAPLANAAEIVITQPGHEATIHNNQGEVRVSVQTSGAPSGTSVRLLVDGAVLPNNGGGPTITLHGINRGSHVLKAELLNAGGAVLAASKPVTFYLWQASSRNPRQAK